MVDLTVKVITPATQFAFLTLDEAKIALGLSAAADPINDPQLQWLINVNSNVIATLCNRTFAKEEVRETWRCLMPNRMFLTHWPVKEADVQTITVAGGDPLATGTWEIEEDSGKLLLPSGTTGGPIVITYTGGYVLPDEAPMALKEACAMLVAVTRADTAAAETSGIRMIAHKEKRIMFHPPSAAGGTGGGTAPGARSAVKNILEHFMRHWV